MKNCIWIVVILFSIFANAQSGSVAPNISSDLPSIIPPSPTAFQMTQYGEIPVNESMGSINPSISLFNYVAGKLELPIGMNYNGDGVKVDQAVGRTGIGWNLDATGVKMKKVKIIKTHKIIYLNL